MESIITYIDNYLIENNLTQISAVDANAALAKAGILKDSRDRPGKPLRELLRKNKIPYAFQIGYRWFIPLSNIKSESHFLQQTKISEVKKTNEKLFVDILESQDITTLLTDSNFKELIGFKHQFPDLPGLYCIKLKKDSKLPKNFNDYLQDRSHNILYMGIATKSLQHRLQQELLAKGHGTFFRSLGAVLGYTPIEGSLLNKPNQKNYKFSENHQEEIINWITKNLKVNWIVSENNLPLMETYLIQKYTPLLNIDKNPLRLLELSLLRAECVNIAKGINKI